MPPLPWHCAGESRAHSYSSISSGGSHLEGVGVVCVFTLITAFLVRTKEETHHAPLGVTLDWHVSALTTVRCPLPAHAPDSHRQLFHQATEGELKDENLRGGTPQVLTGMPTVKCRCNMNEEER